MDEEELFSVYGECFKVREGSKFTIGKIYWLRYNRMNDIVFFCVKNDDNNTETFHEKEWQKYFIEI